MSLEGQQLGRYRLQQLLGSGGMGEVYLATDTLINRQVAIKVIRSEVSSYPDADVARESARLFQREMKAIAMLDHPHIMPLFDYGEAAINGASLSYLVMPYRQEGSLATWLQHRSTTNLLSPQDVAFLISQAADALQNAHDHAIIHQDVKLANFLIRRAQNDPDHPDLLLADFGVSKFNSATANASQSIRGTPTSMAPEQWEGAPVPATDQYALAIMAYELLTGRPPFQGGLSQLMYQHFHTAPPSPSSFNPRLPADVDIVLLHALAKKPAERFGSISAFARAFQQAVSSGLPTMVSEPAPVNVSPTPVQQASSGIHAVLAISSTEASDGATRTLTLPDGYHVAVRVPAGAYDGQQITVQEPGGPDRPPVTLTLTLAIQQANAQVLPDNTEQTMRASNSDLVPPNNPAITPFLGQPPNPPPPPESTSFQPSKTPVPNPDSLPPTILASHSNAQQTVKEFTAPVAPTPTMPPPVAPRPGAKWRNALLAGLALLVILSGLGIFSLVHNGQVASDQANATTTTQANLSAATAAANATSTAEVNVIATQVAIDNNQVTATAVAYQNLYNSSTSGNLVLNDPLIDNSHGNGWSEGSSTDGGTCQFTGGAYHVTTTNETYIQTCNALSTNFSNFAFSVQMRVVNGDCGGLTFRADSANSKFYYWRVCALNGYYGLLLYTNSNSNSSTQLAFDPSPGPINGPNQVNLLTVIARGQTIILYINKQEVVSVNDGTYSHGQVGVTAEGASNSPAADVAYNDAKVWTL